MASEYQRLSGAQGAPQPFLEALPRREQYTAVSFLRQFLQRDDLPQGLDTLTPGERPYTEMLQLLSSVSDEYHRSGVVSERQFRDPTLPRISVLIFDNDVVHMLAETQAGEPFSHAMFNLDVEQGDMVHPFFAIAERNANDVIEEATGQGIKLVRHVSFEPLTYSSDTFH